MLPTLGADDRLPEDFAQEGHPHVDTVVGIWHTHLKLSFLHKK